MSIQALGRFNVATSGFIERLAFRWVQKYIHAFGGDPSKVTMYVGSPLNVESADAFQLGSKCWCNLGITPDVGK